MAGAKAEGYDWSYTEPTAPTYTVVTPATFYSFVVEDDLVTVESVTVDFVSGSTAFVSASGSSMVVYSSGHGLEVGDVATISGTVSAYNDALQLGSVTVTDKVSGGSSTITPTSYTISALNEVIATSHMTYVELTGVNFETSNYLTDATGSVKYYNNYYIDTPEDYASYAIKGYVYISEKGNQIYPTSIVGEGEQIVDPDAAASTTVTYAVADVFPTGSESNGTEYASLTEADGYTTTEGFNFVFAGTSSTTARTWYYSSAWQLRVYTGDTMTITAPEGKVMTEIDFGGTASGLLVTDGEYANTVWTGSANSVVFSVSATCYITSIAITYADAE